MEFQRAGRIYAEEEGRVIAEVTFPDRDGAADIDHICGRYAPGSGVAGQLLQAAADQIRAEEARQGDVFYAEIWLRHPEEADLLCP